MAGNHITFQLAIRRQHPVLNRERLCMDVKCPNLLVMRQYPIQSIQRRLHLLAGYAAGHDCRKISAPISHKHNLLRSRNVLQQLIFDRLRSDVMARAKNNQVLDSADNAPVAFCVDLALVPSMKPAVTQHLGSFLWPVPISGKNVRPADDDFIVLAELHFDSLDGWANASGFNLARVVQGADSSSFGESIALHYRDAEHHEVALGLHTQRSRATDKGFQIRANHLFADGRKHERMGQPLPEATAGVSPLFLETNPRSFRPAVNCLRRSASLP